METCVQCRGCEPACPSGVPFGHLMEGTREALADAHRTAPRWLRAGFGGARPPPALLAGSTLLAVAQRLRLVPRRAGLARLPLRRGPRVEPRRPPAPSTSGSTPAASWTPGCATPTAATAALIEATGATFAVSPDGCCGALHAHAGLGDARPPAGRAGDGVDAGRRADRRQLGRVRRGDEGLRAPASARRRRRRSRRGSSTSRSGWPPRVDRLPPPAPPPRPGDRPGSVPPAPRPAGARAGAHGRSATSPTSSSSTTTGCAAAPAVRTRRCSRRSPATSGSARWRPIGRAAARSGATVVASANPGCAMHLAAAGLTVRHPVDLVAEAIGLTPGR